MWRQTPHTKPPPAAVRYTRLILDESHLYEHKAEPKLPPGKILKGYEPRFIWCVTGTPFSTSLEGLKMQVCHVCTRAGRLWRELNPHAPRSRRFARCARQEPYSTLA